MPQKQKQKQKQSVKQSVVIHLNERKRPVRRRRRQSRQRGQSEQEYVNRAKFSQLTLLNQQRSLARAMTVPQPWASPNQQWNSLGGAVDLNLPGHRLAPPAQPFINQRPPVDWVRDENRRPALRRSAKSVRDSPERERRPLAPHHHVGRGTESESDIPGGGVRRPPPPRLADPRHQGEVVDTLTSSRLEQLQSKIGVVASQEKRVREQQEQAERQRAALIVKEQGRIRERQRLEQELGRHREQEQAERVVGSPGEWNM